MQRLQELLASHGQDAQLDLFKHVRIAKVCNDLDEPVPAGVEVLLADGNDEQSAGEQWQELLTEPLLIVGGHTRWAVPAPQTGGRTGQAARLVRRLF